MRHAATALLTLAGAISLAACSSSTGGTGGVVLHGGSSPVGSSAPPVVATHASTHASSQAPTAFPTASQSAPSTATSPSEVPGTASGSAVPSHVPNELDPLLLTGAEVGPHYRPTDVADPSPLPCTPDQPPVDDQLRHVEKASSSLFDATDNTEVSEEVYVYASATEAVRHQQISEAGLACKSGTIGGAAITVVGPENVAKQLYTNTSKAEGWNLANGQIKATLVLVRINAVVVQFSFVADRAVQPAISAQAVIDKALAKIVSGH